jgi:hypothetical protein
MSGKPENNLLLNIQQFFFQEKTKIILKNLSEAKKEGYQSKNMPLGKIKEVGLCFICIWSCINSINTR